MGNVPPGVFDDSSQLELVNAVIEKTHEGRLRWRRENDTYEADLPEGGQLIFFVSAPRLFGPKTWAHFIVRRRDGTEIFTVQHTEFPEFEGTANNALQSAVAQLFSIVTGSARVEVEKVIEQIKNL